MAYLPSPEVVVPNPPLRVRDVDRRREVISKGAPHGVVAVDRDRVIDAERARLLDDVVDGSLEEFGLFPGREDRPCRRDQRVPRHGWRLLSPSPAHEVPGPDSDRRDCRSFARFIDPDGKGWVLREVKERGSRAIPDGASFDS